MANVKEFKEKIIQDEAFAAKFASAKTPEDVVALAKANGFDFTVEDVKNNTELTDAELSSVAGGATILAKSYFVSDDTVFARTYFVNR